MALVRVCRLKHAGLEVDGEAGWVVGAGQVVAGGAALRVRGGGGEHAAVLLDRHHAALVADRVHRVLVRVRRLEQAALTNTLGYHRAKYFFRILRWQNICFRNCCSERFCVVFSPAA